jgi:hypothetical protein
MQGKNLMSTSVLNCNGNGTSALWQFLRKYTKIVAVVSTNNILTLQ